MSQSSTTRKLRDKQSSDAKRVLREQQAAQAVRDAVSGQLNRVAVFCFLFLTAGIVVGYGIATRQSRVLVDQVQREVRGISADIQGLEETTDRHVQTQDELHKLREQEYRAEIAQLHRAHRAQMEGVLRRTELIEDQVQRQIAMCEANERSCLSELRPYEQRKLAIPVDDVTQAVDRLMLTQAESFRQLLDSVHTQTIEYQSQIAAMELPDNSLSLSDQQRDHGAGQSTDAPSTTSVINLNLFRDPALAADVESGTKLGTPSSSVGIPLFDGLVNSHSEQPGGAPHPSADHGAETTGQPRSFQRSQTSLPDAISTVQEIAPPCSDPTGNTSVIAIDPGQQAGVDHDSHPELHEGAAPSGPKSETASSAPPTRGLLPLTQSEDSVLCPPMPEAQLLLPIPEQADGTSTIAANQTRRFFAQPSHPRGIFFASGRKVVPEATPTIAPVTSTATGESPTVGSSTGSKAARTTVPKLIPTPAPDVASRPDASKRE